MSHRLARLPQVLFEIGKVIGGDERDVASLLVRISELVTQLVDARACSVMLLDAKRERLLGKAAYGLDRNDVSAISFRVGEGVAGWVAARGEPALIEDVSIDSRYIELPDSDSLIRSLACVPLIARDEPIGVLTTTSTHVGAFSASDLELLSFVARTIALDIENIRLRRLSITDPLTQAFNREYLHVHLPRALSAAAARNAPYSVALIDIDHFKQVNDCHGHAVGDRVLTAVADRLRHAVRDCDSVIRYGGEEFLALLPSTDEQMALDIAERIRARLHANDIRIGKRKLNVHASVGVANWRGAKERGADLIKRADRALYRAKQGGRNRVERSP